MQDAIGTKRVKLKPMNRQQYNDYRGLELPDDENGDDDGYLVEYTDGGKPNHPDHAGYISWSPKAQADAAYQESGNMSFGHAVVLAKAGFKVARRGWNGVGMFAFLESNTGKYKTVNYADGSFKNFPLRECWMLKTAQGDIAHWAPSGSDSLADDWCVVD